MNYYEHHLGDYDGATAHLSWLEDCAYRRLICLYYRSEQPIPADIKQACRLVRASSKPERDAVQQVLSEFFSLGEDGWHNGRCDEDIARYLESEPERQARRDNDKERQQRTRARRKGLFDALRVLNIVPAYDTKTSELEAMLSRASSPPVTRDVTPPVTRDNTATQTPVTRHQSPEEKEYPPASRVPPAEAGRATKKCPDSFVVTNDLVEWATENAPEVNVSVETAKLRDHTFATARKDWAGTWRNWMRKAAENVGGRRLSNGTNPFDEAH